MPCLVSSQGRARRRTRPQRHPRLHRTTWAGPIFSCFGNTDAKTPNVDRLAARASATRSSTSTRHLLAVAHRDHEGPVSATLADHLLPQQPRRQRAARGGAMARSARPDARAFPETVRLRHRTLRQVAHGRTARRRDRRRRSRGTCFDESLTNFEGMGRKAPPADALSRRREAGRIWEDAEASRPAFHVDAALEDHHRFHRRRDSVHGESGARGKPFYVNLWPGRCAQSVLAAGSRKWAGDKRGPLSRGARGNGSATRQTLRSRAQHAALRDNTLILVCIRQRLRAGRGIRGPVQGLEGRALEGGIRSPLVVVGAAVKRPRRGITTRRRCSRRSNLAPSLLRFTKSAGAGGVVFDG